MDEAGSLEPYNLHYSDLMLLSSEGDSLSSSAEDKEIARLESVRSEIMEALGPSGPGLLTVTHVPNASLLRRNLLPFARKLALLNNEDRKRILSEHGLGSDVSLKNPDRIVSSFAMQLKYVQALEPNQSELDQETEWLQSNKQDLSDLSSLGYYQNEFHNIGGRFKELGYCMMELGIRLARICDRAIGGVELQETLLESCSAKGRLIHYHSTKDNVIINENAKKKGSIKGRASHKSQFLRRSRDPNLDRSMKEVKAGGDGSKLWQPWHYDYGVFTVLTAPLFVSSSGWLSWEVECPYPSEHTHLQIFDPTKNGVLNVRASPESVIVQVGESADILSKGKLRSTLHSVCRPEGMEYLSRETFVVFLQPAWTKTFSISGYPMQNFSLGDDKGSELCAEENTCAEMECNKITREIYKTVPPLSSRVRDGMTFAEFSRETTKQYYGGSGLQSNR